MVPYMKKKHLKLLQLIFKRPISANVQWREVESFLKEQGAVIKERGGSRVAIRIGDHVLHHHRPHPSPNMDKGAVAALRDYLENCGIMPDGGEK